jgi:DNA polymerase IV
MGPRKIIHVDLDAFFCSVEELRRPELAGVPFAVGGSPETRGVVASCSYAARKYGVHSAMPMSQALRQCPRLVIVPGDHPAYGRASERVMAIFHNLTGLVEQISIDEAFLDVSDLPQTGIELGRALQAQVQAQTGLPCSLGVASNKLVAKIATDQAKKRHSGEGAPRAILEVPAGSEAAFLAPLPTEAMWGVGPKTAARLAELGIRTVGQLAALSDQQAAARFGKNGLDLVKHARGEDTRPVVTERETKSISEEITFDRDISDSARLHETLRSMAEGVGRSLRANHLTAGTVRLKLRWPDFTTLTRQVSVPGRTDQDGIIYELVSELFGRVWQPGKAVRLLGVGAANLSEGAHQPGLWDSDNEKERRLLEAVDQLRDRFGNQSIQLGYRINHDDQKNKQE